MVISPKDKNEALLWERGKGKAAEATCWLEMIRSPRALWALVTVAFALSGRRSMENFEQHNLGCKKDHLAAVWEVDTVRANTDKEQLNYSRWGMIVLGLE